MFTSSPKQNQRLVTVIHVGFFLIGIVNTLLGPILPLLSLRWRLDDTQAGSLFFIQSIGAIAGSALTGTLIRRFGFQAVLLSGFGVMSVSTLGLGFSSWLAGVICIAGIGLSLGLSIPTINVLISAINSTRRAAALNILNLAWGLGAVVGPLLIPLLSQRTSLSLVLTFAAAPIALVAMLVRTDSQAETGPADVPATSRNVWLTPYFLLTAAFVFINIGTESAMGGWIASYVKRLDQSSQLAWGVATSLFWGGILIGRALAPIILRQISEVTMVLFGILIVVAGLLVVLFSSRSGVILLGVGLTGFGLAPVFPTTIALFTGKFKEVAASLTGTLFIFAGLGSAVFPWVVGLVSTRYQDLHFGLIVPFVGAVLMLALHITMMVAPKVRSSGEN
jgi:MFS transporter, FHS family, glucose/mannose:H+ symporter